MPTDFRRRRVIAFGSRRADDLRRLLRSYNAAPLVAPTVRIVPAADGQAVDDLRQALGEGRVDVVIFQNATGVRLLADALAPDSLPDLLGQVTVASRSPHLAETLSAMGVTASVVASAPHTWREITPALKASGLDLNGLRVAVQECGRRNGELNAALEEAGATVLPVTVYEHADPGDASPLQQALAELTAGCADYCLFTNGAQARALFSHAEAQGETDRLRHALRRTCVASIGPTCSQALRDLAIGVDFESDACDMESLVRELARRGEDLLAKKRAAVTVGVDTHAWRRCDMRWPRPPGDSIFLQACRREPTPYTPVWFMRQAGRFQRAYRELRADHSILDVCKTPELAAEVTLMAVDQLGVDAGIIFSDILVVCEPMGLQLEFVKGEGPVFHNPVRTGADVDRLRDCDGSEVAFVAEAVGLTRAALRPDIALIGFSGGPFTIASYMVEGGKSRNYVHLKTMLYSQPDVWQALMDRLCPLLAQHLRQQIEAGADAVQIFDSWAGVLSPDDYREFVLPHVTGIVESLPDETPVIQFATGNPALLPCLKETGGDIIGLDWRVDLAEAWDRLGDDVGVMGNLDPIVLYSPTEVVRKHVRRILDKAARRPGHIFNLGHGVLPDMRPERLAELADMVHELSARETGA